MSFRAGLVWGTLGAAIAAAVAALRVAEWSTAFVVLLGSSALVVAPAIAALSGLGSLTSWLRALLAGLGVSALVLAKLASVLMVATHHRPLGAITFAVAAVAIVLGATVIAARVFALAGEGGTSARWAARVLVVVAALSLLAVLVPAALDRDVARGLFDVTLALGASALIRLLPWPPAVGARSAALGVPIWIAAVALAVVVGRATSFDPARLASPTLSAPLTGLFP